MTKIKPESSTAQRGLIAEVGAEVTVKEDGRLDIVLDVKAENKGQLIALDQKEYVIPVSNACCIKAWDAKGALDARFIKDHIEVHFRKGERLPTGETHEWQISFETRGCFDISEDKTMIFGPYVIDPQTDYNGIPIHVHKFVVMKFIFKKPGSKWWWPFKVIHVVQSNSEKIAPAGQQKRRWGATEYVFEPFHLAMNERLKINFGTSYRFSSLMVALATFIVTTGVGEVIKWLLRSFVHL